MSFITTISQYLGYHLHIYLFRRWSLVLTLTHPFRVRDSIRYHDSYISFPICTLALDEVILDLLGVLFDIRPRRSSYLIPV